MTPTSLLCRAAVPLAPIATGELMYMPGGLQSISPIDGGIEQPIQVLVNAGGARALESQRAALAAKGKRPYFDFNHEDGEASFWPEAFYWKDAPEPGIYARGEWTSDGRAKVEGKAWRQFSPVFHVDNKRAHPARIVGREWARPNMGGLVNDPAFHSILPLWAKETTDHPIPSLPSTPMTPQEIPALQARLLTLEQDITALRAQATDDSTTELAAREADLTATQAALQAAQATLDAATARAETEALKTKNSALEAADRQRREAYARRFAGDMVARGAIAARDAATVAEVEKNIAENAATFEPIYARWSGNPALAGRLTPSVNEPRGEVRVTQTAARDALQAYSSLVAKNAAIKTVSDPDKSRLAGEAAALFARELKGREEDWIHMPLDQAIKAADNTNPALGTLAGTLVLQRTLPLLKFNYPMLLTLFSDFSDSVGLWGQTETTRIPITPAVTEYDPTLDSSGRPNGFVVTVPAQTVDVPIQLTKHVGIPMVFGVQTLASTIRNLFAEQAAGAINALGGYFVDMATALMTPANFNAYKQVADTTCVTTTGQTGITLDSTAGLYPGQEISGTGIPTGAHIASITGSTTAVMTMAATATSSSGSPTTITLGGGKVPTLYPTYVQALSGFDFASLGQIGAAFDNNRVPYESRCTMLTPSYYAQLAQDPAVNSFFAATRSPDIISKGLLPELNGFTPQKAPWFPTTNNRVGFAYHPAALVLKSRLPQDFTKAVSAMIPGTVTTVTDPDTRISVLHIERVDLVARYAESSIEVMLGAAVGDARAGLVITSS